MAVVTIVVVMVAGTNLDSEMLELLTPTKAPRQLLRLKPKATPIVVPRMAAALDEVLMELHGNVDSSGHWQKLFVLFVSFSCQ